MTRKLEQLKDWKVEVDIENIAWAIIDREGETTNTLGRRVLEELGEIVTYAEGAAARKEIVGLVFISGKPSGFIAGADIREFENVKSEAEVTEALTLVNGLLDRIEKMSIPVVAAIHGFCLGGGLELALACHWRIADREDGTRIGFPEVKLGIFPGFNGTARSIRSAGPVNAMQAMLTGGMLRSSVARAQGLVDELVETHDRLRWAARKAVLRKRRSEGAGMAGNIMRQWPARGLLAKQIRSKTAEKARADHYPAPFKLIDLFEQHGGDLEKMKREETKAFPALLLSDTSRNLRRVFGLMERLKAQAPKGAADPKRLHVIGAGTMGADIAAWGVISGMQVSLQDLKQDVIDKGIERAKGQFQRRYKKKVDVDAALARLVSDPEGKHVSRADVIIEAIVERLDAKQSVFKGLEGRLKPGAVMATNTSSIPVEEIAAPLADPGRLVGIHFFNPVAMMPLVEVVRGAHSRDAEINKACTFVTAISKLPLIVKSSPGFLVNRVLGPYLQEAMKRLDAGTQREMIDDAAKAFGMPMGPLEVADTVGLDICAHVAQTLGLDKEGDAKKLRALLDAGKLGKKTGEGFYKWEKGKPVRDKLEASDAALKALGAELVEPLIKECEKCLADGVVADADLVDAGVIFGSGFAPFRGGPLHYARSKGASTAAAVARAAE